MDVRSVLSSTKTISIATNWVKGDDERLWVVAPLEIDGITVQGLILRVRVFKDRPDEDALFQLEFEHDPKRKDKAIERIDWKPSHTHENRGNGPPDFRFIRQNCTHYHQFDLNWLSNENRLKMDNLPVAVPISDDPVDFKGILAFVGKNFRISNIELIGQPGWEPRLL
jgi:hypothetical protein